MDDIKPPKPGDAKQPEPTGAPATKIPVTDVQPLDHQVAEHGTPDPVPPVETSAIKPEAPADTTGLSFEDNTPDNARPVLDKPELAIPPAESAEPTPTPPTEDSPGTPVHPGAPMQTAKKKTPLPVIIVALLVAIGLAVVLVYVFMKGRESTSKTNTTTPPAATQQARQNVTAKDVDTTATDIDKEISTVDEKKDLSANDLSDQTLGL